MDEFFQLWFEEGFMVDQSAFLPYTNQPFEGFGYHQNVNKRMMEFLKKKSCVGPARVEMMESEEDRLINHRHKISERMRREKHRLSYISLHELLPLGTKGDKKSILEMAAKEIEELQQYKEELGRQNREMEEMILGKAVEKAEIKLKVAYPASGIDSMLEVLRCLKETGSTAIAIQSSFSEHEFDAKLEVETKIRAAEVEKAVQKTLFEAEMKFLSKERQWSK